MIDRGFYPFDLVDGIVKHEAHALQEIGDAIPADWIEIG